jgi:hypothetical protein
MRSDNRNEANNGRSTNNRRDRAVAKRETLQNNPRNNVINQKERERERDKPPHLTVTTHEAIMRPIRRENIRVKSHPCFLSRKSIPSRACSSNRPN